MILTDDTVLHKPMLETSRLDGVTILLDPTGPNWAGTDERGKQILSGC